MIINTKIFCVFIVLTHTCLAELNGKQSYGNDMKTTKSVAIKEDTVIPESEYLAKIEKKLTDYTQTLNRFKSSQFSFDKKNNKLVIANQLSEKDRVNKAYILLAFDHIKGMFDIPDGTKVIVNNTNDKKLIIFGNQPPVKDSNDKTFHFGRGGILVTIPIDIKTKKLGPMMLEAG